MTRPALRTERRAVRWSRLLLFAALLLGIAAMHTLGHPDRSHAMEDAPAGHSVAPAAHGSTELPDGSAMSGASAAAAAEARDLTEVVAVVAAAAPRPHTGMDPMSVCVAVLGALTLLILGAGLAGPRRAAPLGGAARAPGLPGGRDPPPPRELLDLLTVLRV
ncbi:hypothetical protein J7F03_22955 [Streptomyces sp. ISL-43]|uniref:hypothetical protein n=1 Tax=Streptomyces sp. ISL-43 TaxID=2819183 RepID=UPI001BEAC332|nr:hypothetical protein [Streptomyces sp. ISL-43]MBT2449880.1 hypothetical protein [Streptomyces sp. ISL-43]